MKIIECPRDAMQGLTEFIPTPSKVRYLNALLEVGFDTIDIGSFVSPKAIPQMRDTAEVLEKVEHEKSTSKLLVIVANQRGADDAVTFEQVDYLGFPLSISETFQQRNTNKSIAQAKEVLYAIKETADKHGKEVVTYLSMGFGNPYGDAYSPQMVTDFAGDLAEKGFPIISLADTIGSADVPIIEELFATLIPALPTVEIGAHLHTVPAEAVAKVKAVIGAGGKRLDGAIGGMGGCPMAKDDLTGNMPTESILGHLTQIGEKPTFNFDAYQEASRIKQELFG